MRILVDECLPKDLVGWLKGLNVKTVQQVGWAGVKNGELLRRAESEFDVFLTADRNLRYQQNLKARRLAILVLLDQYVEIVIPDRELAEGNLCAPLRPPRLCG